jgi:hypothetical protein
MTLPADVRERVLRAAKDEPSPTRARLSLRNAAILAGAFAISGSIFAFVGLAPLPASFLGLCALGWSVVAIVASTAALLKGKSMLGLPTHMLAIAALLTAPIVGAWVLAASDLGDVPKEMPKPVGHVLCFVLGIVLSAAPFLAFVVVRMRSDPVHPRARGAAIGAAAGAWGGLLIELHCRFAHPLHAIVGHVLPIAALAAIGALLGRRAIGLR